MAMINRINIGKIPTTYKVYKAMARNANQHKSKNQKDKEETRP